jgi:phospholipid/cholesterol/gamma-HCH transport system substrate-binding protein
METKANYVVVGLFTLAFVVGIIGFVYWFQSSGGSGERAYYRIVFDGSVSGLRTGGAVLFNGIRVGEVAGLKLDPQKPEQVVATIAVDKNVAVRPDTQVGMEFQGLTGIASLALKGGNPATPPLDGDKDNPPLLLAPAGATADVTQTAREVLHKLDGAIANIDKFTAMLSKNAERIDHIASGLENLTGGNDGKGGEINEAARSIRIGPGPTMSSRCCSTRFRMRNMISVRLLMLVARQPGKAPFAAATAASTSSTDAKSTWRATAPVAGL